MYVPNNWVVIKITKDDTIVYKLLGGWSGGYLDGDSWRMNSGIISVKNIKKPMRSYYDFHGYSGSVYRCPQDTYGIRMSTAGIFETLQKQAKQKKNVTVELMPEATDWLELFSKGGDL